MREQGREEEVPPGLDWSKVCVASQGEEVHQELSTHRYNAGSALTVDSKLTGKGSLLGWCGSVRVGADRFGLV